MEIHEVKVCENVHSNRWLTLREVPDEVGISKKSCCGTLTEHLGMRRVADKYVPQSAEWRQKTKWVEVSQEHFGSANNDENFCEKMSLQVKRNGFTAMLLKRKPLLTMGLKNIRQNRKTTASSVKCEGDVDCLFLFFYGGAVHHEFSPHGHNVNKQYYLEMIKCQQEAVKEKGPI